MLGPLREGIMTILIVAGPIIIAAAAVGLLIGILQAATQVQDQTIPSAIKLIGVMLLLVFLGMWMFSYLTRFTEKTIGKAFSMVMLNRDSIPYSQDIKSGEEELGDTIKRSPVDSQHSSNPNIPSNAPFSSYGRLSSTQGSFNVTLSPPIKAFSNAMQTSPSPKTYTYNQKQNYKADPTFNNPNHSRYHSPSSYSFSDNNNLNNLNSTVDKSFRSYSNQQNYDDLSESFSNGYPPLPDRNFHQSQSSNSTMKLNTQRKRTNSRNKVQRNNPYSEKTRSDKNKVFLSDARNNKELTKEESYKPKEIFKPKLPSYTNSQITKEDASSSSKDVTWW
ncbi:MAG: flagellar biosynthetic protein FliQ [Candidatus Caenarcaniphilales bacterium]|nr:flagellar biosynthetic protein FliQ [Candidatus Caenarcaniphilales bacterium]